MKNRISDNNIHLNEIDVWKFIEVILKKRNKLIFSIVCGICFGSIIAFSLPLKYTVNLILSPEYNNSSASGMMNMASVLGLGNLNKMDQDAVNSSIVPEIISSTPFLVELYDIDVRDVDGEKYKLYDYLDRQKIPWWNKLLSMPRKLIAQFSKDNENIKVENDSIDDYRLSYRQYNKINSLRSSITGKIDKKSNLTKITVTFDDPEVCAIVGDSVVNKLQKYIVEYKINKARNVCNYLNNLCKEKKEEYIKAQNIYAEYSDKNRNILSNKTQANVEKLRNDVSIALEVYRQVETQLQLAKAKLQEEKPNFAVVEPSSVPLYPSSPNKKMVISVFAILFLIVELTWILFLQDIVSEIKQRNIKIRLTR